MIFNDLTMLATLGMFFFVLGTIVGSFLNVVILRYNTGRSVNGRSSCMSCRAKLGPLDLLPVISWLVLRGRCRSCKAKISPQYPLVEFFTGALFAGLFVMAIPFLTNFTSPALFVLYYVWNAIIFSILMVIFVYDIHHKIIPDGLSYSFAIMAFLQTFILSPTFSNFDTLAYLDFFSGAIMFVPFFLLWFVSAGRWIGLGDGKLALGIGWYLGFIHGLSAIVLGFWIGALYAVVIMLIERLNLSNKNITMKSEIPFAPFLIIGTILQFFWQIDVLGVSLFF